MAVQDYWGVIGGLIAGGAAYGQLLVKSRRNEKDITENETKNDKRNEAIMDALTDLKVGMARIEERVRRNGSG